MSWKVTKANRNFSSQELKIIVRVKEIAEYTYATYSEQIINQIHEDLKTIKRGNNYSAEIMYQATPRNLKSIEVWKMTAQGDFNFKILQADYNE